MRHACAGLDTPIGRRWAVVSPRGLIAVAAGDLPPFGTEPDAAAAGAAASQLAAYFDGRLRAFSLRLDLRGRPAFDAAVWRAAMEIPYGETVSYGELAMMAGHPRAARAVGGAMARCPLFPVVPCHRVIHADASLGGWGSEMWIKQWLLDMEAAAR